MSRKIFQNRQENITHKQQIFLYILSYIFLQISVAILQILWSRSTLFVYCMTLLSIAYYISRYSRFPYDTQALLYSRVPYETSGSARHRPASQGRLRNLPSLAEFLKKHRRVLCETGPPSILAMDSQQHSDTLSFLCSPSFWKAFGLRL